MIGAIVFFVLLFGYFGIVKGESDSLKVFLAIIGIVAVVWLIHIAVNYRLKVMLRKKKKIYLHMMILMQP